MGTIRARVLGGLAAAALVVGTAGPAWADEPPLTVQVVLGGPEYLDSFGSDSEPVTVDVFAVGDAVTPVVSVTGESGSGFGDGIAVSLDPGTYRVRASAEGWRPSWYRGTTAAGSADWAVIGLYGWHADATFASATDIVVAPGAATVVAPLMLFRSPSSVLGLVARWHDYGFDLGQNWSDKDVFVDLVPTAGGAMPPLAADRGAFSFEDVAPGTYAVRATIGTTADGGVPAGPDDLIDPEVWWYPGTASEAARGTITVQPGGGHWVAANIATDTLIDPGAGGVVVSGDTYEGGVLSASFSIDEAQAGLPDLSLVEGYQWSVGGEPAVGATQRTFTVPAGTAGSIVSVELRGQYLPGALRFRGTAEAAITAAPGTPFSAPTPTISGTPAPGSTLTAQPGTWTPAGQKSFQWLRDGQPIAGATTIRYAVTADDIGHALRVTVSATNGGYALASRTSDAVRVAELSFTSLSTPTTRGQARVGATLTAGAGVAKPAAATTSWQWYRNGAAIPGATATTYVPTVEDIGAAISVGVGVQRPGYALRTDTSVATTAVQPGTITAPKPTITGTPKVGTQLSATTTGWGPAPLTLTYQWERANGGVYSAIPGAVASTYTPVAADRNKKVRVTVTATRPGYADATKTSAATTAVAP